MSLERFNTYVPLWVVNLSVSIAVYNCIGQMIDIKHGMNSYI